MKQTPDTTPLAERLAAISEPLRLRLCRLLEQHELSVGEVAKVLQLPQSTASRHLKVLAASGWVDKRAEGTATFYRLMLDDLQASTRALWVTVREQMEPDPQLEEDRRRLEGVLAERTTDSLSFFGRVAGEWDSLREHLFGHQFTSKALLALLPRHWTVADLGCGTGNGAEMLAPHVRRVIAIDQSGPMLEAARKRLSRLSNVEFVQAPIEALPLPASSIDAATCLLVLHHLREPVDALREMRRVIRPGGVVLVLDMLAHDRTVYKHTMGHAHLGFSEPDLRRLFGEAGFPSVTIAALPSDPQARGPGLFVAVAATPPPTDGEGQ
ncbi:MAG: metalloregulator ArsR/SmtB family transcription factor [Phycisphaerales bacterium]|nr:metalloregulator ArsR/SmtB family transcription factor [Phycisphaerales bacterium]